MKEKMMSAVYKFEGKLFRYDFNNGIVEYLYKADKEMIKDEEEWKASHNGRSLYDIDEDGYSLIDSIGLRKENWKNKAVRDEYLAEWIAELEYETRLMAREFMI